MAEERPFAARRILVGMDASAASRGALATAAALAGRLGSELTGLFVEDEDLLRLATLPFGAVVRPGGEEERLDPDAAERALRALAAHAREELERAAASHRVACSFRVARGRVAREVLAAAEGVDLVVLGAAGHGRPSRGAVGDTARAAAVRARTSVLLLARGSSLGGGVVAVDDGSAAGARALGVARSLAPAARPPIVICAGDGADPALLDPIARLDPALVVLPSPAAAAPGGIVERLLGKGIAVLLAR
ncbi:MAG TPA: universal stress protein [Anaeromyxobacter sp.]|nr:universal stress protein [Anaeromyxobacter sp.]